MNTKEHWESIYQSKSDDRLSWTQLEPALSLKLITQVCNAGHIVDVGGGCSLLTERLIDRGYSVTVLDISQAALDRARTHLGKRAHLVHWLVADITATPSIAPCDVWHDRAVFHFLREEDDRRRYVKAIQGSVRPGGHVVLGTFGPEGPTQCSGLDVVRYSPADLMAALGDAFQLVEALSEIHSTPSGAAQQFTYCHCRLRAA